MGITDNDDSAGRVAVHATLPVVLAEDVAVGTTSLVDVAGSTSPEVGFPAVVKETSLADCVGVASSFVGAGAGRSTVAEVASSADSAGVASPAIAGVASLAVAGAVPSTDIAGVASPVIADVASNG